MNIIQKNIFGDNVIYQVPPEYTRSLDDSLKKEVLSILSNLGIRSAMIRYENGGETSKFSKIVQTFLIDSGFKPVNTTAITQSEIQRNEFSIQLHPSESDWAIIKIGPLI